mmetsp:Transcript_30260/g.51171  ORF Transcript_30260/g.51171 Transcript_30260/m.51171 type:complete len:357 (+) Transcript_30260:196-1266(+)
MGKGGKMNVVGRSDFVRSQTDEPHVARRKEILKVHPEISELFGPDWRPAPVMILMVAAQLTVAAHAKYMSWPVFFLVAYTFGATVSHSLSLASHETSHGLIFKKKWMNDYFGIFCNMGMGVPASATFKRYHMEHHQFQGVEGKDVDVPTYLEGKVFRSWWMKVLFLIGLPISYGARPGIVSPKDTTFLELVNIVFILSTDFMVFYFLGLPAFMYMFTSTVLGHGLHPISGHFIAEHFVFVDGQETYSYYGCLNYLTWNVGYHNEHHDFPRVPGWKLPQVKKIAPEYYDSLASYDSWTGVLVRFIFDPEISPFNRVLRAAKYSRRLSSSNNSSSSSSSSSSNADTKANAADSLHQVQ